MIASTVSMYLDQRNNRALRGAFLRGVHAGLAGDAEESCPYLDRRTDRGAVTFSRAFRRAWLHGWRHANDDREQALITARYGT